MRATYQVFGHQVALFLKFIGDTPMLKAIDNSLDGKYDGEEWVKKWEWQSIPLPDDEIQKAALCRFVLIKSAEDNGFAINLGEHLVADTAFQAMIDAVKDNFLLPYYQFLDERLDDGGEMIYLLQKFKVRCEAFDRKALFEAYVTDTPRGEANLDSALRKFLFDQGVDYPFSTPRSASGRADVVAQLGSEDPHPLEVKIFNPDGGYDKAYIAKGFGQAFRYADDYNQAFGYLVVFNVCDKELVFQTADDMKSPQRVVVGDKTVFLISIRVFPDVSASEKGKMQPYIIKDTDLTKDVKGVS
jgi:hypothetical protein